METNIIALLERVASALERIEDQLPAPAGPPPWDAASAFRWQCDAMGHARFIPLQHDQSLRLTDLLGIDRPRDAINRNTAQFVAGLPANNVLLWGPKGTGKSSLVRAVLNEHSGQGLRLVEMAHDALADLWQVVQVLRDRPERFILFFDDLSFESGDPDYRALKAALEGSMAGLPDNVLVYATSNRRHLMPELKQDNQDSHILDGELHHGEAVEEKVSLSERFGLWLALHPFSQERYLEICGHWLRRLDVDAPEQAWRAEALRWALLKGSRSGRSAWQFARDHAGRLRLEASR